MSRAPFIVSLCSLGIIAAAWSAGGYVVGPVEEMIRMFREDKKSLGTFYALDYSEADRERKEVFYEGWKERLAGEVFEDLDGAGRIDYLLFDKHLERDRERLDEQWAKLKAAEDNYVPFLGGVIDLLAQRRAVEEVEGKQAAGMLEEIAGAVSESIKAAETRLGGEEEIGEQEKILVRRSRQLVERLQRDLGEWGRFYKGYDPVVTWWVEKPLAKLDDALGEYAKVLGGDVGENDAPVVGDPIGEEALLKDLRAEFISYSPAELVAIAEKEFAWCDAEMLKASQELGFGDDWKKALDYVAEKYVEPGEQTYLIKEMAEETVAFLKERDLVTIPPLCEENWEMRMMSPERQKVSPYFLGGQTILVSFPTDAMEHTDKLMSLRSNNRHFSRAVVHHELIPGHHLQLFMAQRYKTHREAFRTPFFVEGWALYWEMLLWDKGFAESPEDRIGMLFWRSHRCARILFSLKFHLGEMTAQEAVDFLVERVGHERNNATAEVRRSVSGDYSPLYQAAYMLGGLQLMELRRELVDSGKMGEKEFHDAVLREGSVPVRMVRAALSGEILEKGADLSWRFYPE